MSNRNMRKPRLFIASSAESLDIAEAVNVNLDHDFEVNIWKSGTFKLSSTSLDDIIKKSSSVDFALFIFAPDDIATIKNKTKRIVRDNVLFEMGLFIGAIGKERSFILQPRDEEMHLPTDLLGTTPADYDAKRTDGNLVAATNRACTLIKTEVERMGLINYASLSETKILRANPTVYELDDVDLKFLLVCLRSHTSNPSGLDYDDITRNLKSYDDFALQIVAVKLERMGLIERSISTNDNGYDYYRYMISEAGIDILLKNEDKLKSKVEPDDIPF